MKQFLDFSLLVVLMSFPPSLFGHHGKEYMVNSTYKTAGRGHFFALLSADYTRAGHHGGGFEISPGILYGITDRWGAEFHLHNSLVGEEFHTESLGFETRVRLLGPGDIHGESDDHDHNEESSPFSLAGLLEYSKGLGGVGDVFEARIIAGKDFGPLSLITNLIIEREFDHDESFELRYTMGVKVNLTNIIAAGIEFDSGSGHEKKKTPRLTPGLYTSLSGTLDFRIGATFDIRPPVSTGSNLILRTTLIVAM